MKNIFALFFVILITVSCLYAEEAEVLSTALPAPVYVSELPNINDYNIFANGGWDGSWYVGFNVCWIEGLPAPAKGEYSRAFIGTKLGRMKTTAVKGKPSWEKEAIKGDIYIGLSSTPSWKSSQSYFLTDTSDIPLEPDFENALEGVGEARWFWREVPISSINFEGPNYVAVWSPTPYFVSTASSPVLCGGWGSKNVNTWLNDTIKGYPPLKTDASLKTPITVFEPAIAMKLIPAQSVQTVTVSIDKIADGRANTANKTFFVSVQGNSIEKTWIETSYDDKTWSKHGSFVYTPPFIFTFKGNNMPVGNIKVRAAAKDVWENTGFSQSVELNISR